MSLMPEPPDFEQIARRVCVTVLGDSSPTDRIDALVSALVLEMHYLWNERGLRDRATLEAELSTMMGGTAAGPYVKNLTRALRGLDR
jgi:hypothetical protein